MTEILNTVPVMLGSFRLLHYSVNTNDDVVLVREVMIMDRRKANKITMLDGSHPFDNEELCIMFRPSGDNVYLLDRKAS
jgi:hypothetical protein